MTTRAYAATRCSLLHGARTLFMLYPRKDCQSFTSSPVAFDRIDVTRHKRERKKNTPGEFWDINVRKNVGIGKVYMEKTFLLP